MRVASHDRGAILDLAGNGHLSPAIRDGVPALVPEEDKAGRDGWKAFFAALDARGLAVAWETDDPSSAQVIPAAEAAALVHHSTFADGMARTRRFLAAWRVKAG